MKQIQKIAQQFESLDIDYSQRLWTMYTTGIDLGVEAASKKRTEILKDKKNFAAVTKFMGKQDLEPTDKRRVEILHSKMKFHHISGKANKIFAQMETMETQLADLLNKHRVSIDGKEVDTTQIKKILNESPDRELRKKAFLARTQVNQPLVDAGFLTLINLRKEYAVACKATDFIALRLESDELTPTLFEGWGDELRKRKKDLRKREKDLAQKLLGAEDMEPWDLMYMKGMLCRDNNAKVNILNFFEPIEKTFGAYGWDISKMNLTYDVFPRKNKSEWGYNFTIHPGKDSRILANVNNSFESFNVLLHETAHGVHFLGLNPEERILNMGVSGIVAEGFANFFGDLSYSKEFITQVFGRDSQDKLKAFEDLRRFTDFMAFHSVNKTLFDHELYRANLKTNDDIMNLSRKLSKDHVDHERGANEIPWAFRIHHTVAPIYLHNYFLGDVMTANMKKAFKKQIGSDADASPKRFGRFWREKVLQPSGRMKFMDLHENVCGTKLKLGGYLDQCLRVGALKAPKSVLEETGRLRTMDL